MVVTAEVTRDTVIKMATSGGMDAEYIGKYIKIVKDSLAVSHTNVSLYRCDENTIKENPWRRTAVDNRPSIACTIWSSSSMYLSLNFRSDDYFKSFFSLRARSNGLKSG